MFLFRIKIQTTKIILTAVIPSEKRRIQSAVQDFTELYFPRLISVVTSSEDLVHVHS